ncbi:unnamed protein product (macronuclear) [Paramecium tetraurelia]|uniref:Endoplasmic reticulum vesicle transporter C-terminal domain-containing protein n=1 Tax=Paramecium tetraurelia TaxID=5888 RepID=A0CTX8_PARTE|nr:uncharacterized protein GSPATT00038978001 [Paramecium tetraurelia]CAK74245.1 unnamed protein product [Paramecium tetraurelia]|eukprot:XP_001441642.1 hypothetical protein (macronuclear) [Paramecium tetraurelia strain d4-2]
MIGGVQSRLRKLDIYRKLPADLTEPTTAGALISVIIILFITELQAYIEVDNSSEMFVDINRGGEQIRVNLDIEFHKFPCDILSLDVQDYYGVSRCECRGEQRMERQFLKKFIQIMKEHEHHNQPSIDFARIEQAFKEKEGCQIAGYIIVNKVPGNFHVSAHAFGGILHQVFQRSQIQTLDLSHTINHISFGEEDDLMKIKKQFQKGVLNPLDNTKKVAQPQGGTGMMFQYYISVVPTTYVDVSGNEYYVHQFTANSNEVLTDHLPAAYFRYDLSPVTVKFLQYRESFLHFLVQICAILGGVFTIASIVDGMIHKSVVALLKKYEMGKLS